MKLEIEVNHSEGDIVYLKSDEKDLARVVIGYLIQSNNIRYHLACGTTTDYHFGVEITKEKSKSGIGFGKK